MEKKFFGEFLYANKNVKNEQSVISYSRRSRPNRPNNLYSDHIPREEVRIHLRRIYRCIRQMNMFCFLEKKI